MSLEDLRLYDENKVMGTFDEMLSKFWCWDVEKLSKDPVKYQEIMSGKSLEDVRQRDGLV